MSVLTENERALIDEYFNLFDANHDGKIVYSEMEKTLKDHSDGENVAEKFTAFLNKYDVSYENNYVDKRMVTDYFAEAKSDEVQIETVLTNLIQNITLDESQLLRATTNSKCPNHELHEYRVPPKSYVCSVCNYNQTVESNMYGCQICDKFKCEKCHDDSFDFSKCCSLLMRQTEKNKCGHNVIQFKVPTAYSCSICEIFQLEESVCYECEKCNLKICQPCHKKGKKGVCSHKLIEYVILQENYICKTCAKSHGMRELLYGCKQCSDLYCKQCYVGVKGTLVIEEETLKVEETLAIEKETLAMEERTLAAIEKEITMEESLIVIEKEILATEETPEIRQTQEIVEETLAIEQETLAMEEETLAAIEKEILEIEEMQAIEEEIEETSDIEKKLTIEKMLETEKELLAMDKEILEILAVEED